MISAIMNMVFPQIRDPFSVRHVLNLVIKWTWVPKTYGSLGEKRIFVFNSKARQCSSWVESCLGLHIFESEMNRPPFLPLVLF